MPGTPTGAVNTGIPTGAVHTGIPTGALCPVHPRVLYAQYTHGCYMAGIPTGATWPVYPRCYMPGYTPWWYMPRYTPWVHLPHSQHGLARTWTTVCTVLHLGRALGSRWRIPLGERPLSRSGPQECERRDSSARRNTPSLREDQMKDWIANGTTLGKSPRVRHLGAESCTFLTFLGLSDGWVSPFPGLSFLPFLHF